MYKLYWTAGSGAMTPQALFEEIGVEYEKIVIDIDNDEHKSPAFLAVNPMAQIPALVLPDGTLMTETAAILLQIVDRHPEAKLAPAPGSPERARFLRWLFFLASNVYPAVLRTYYSVRYSTDPNGAEGVKAANRAVTAYTRQRRKVTLRWPPREFHDYNDALQAVAKESVA